ncbi:MAG: hypothetical protein ACREAN_08215 [Nitrosopumilaceae archaeon]
MQNKRQFSWRNTRDPFKILIAELLLRKTTARQVESVYSEFLEKFPNPKSLASATSSSIENEIERLGIQHQRAVLLKRLSQIIVEEFHGGMPASEEDLKSLPGVGQYGANAVLNLAYGKKVPLVDVNVLRVINRVFGIKSSKKRARNDPEMWNFAKKLLPRKNTRDHNLAMLDFASAICVSRGPKCRQCFATPYCVYYVDLLQARRNQTHAQ